MTEVVYLGHPQYIIHVIIITLVLWLFTCNVFFWEQQIVYHARHMQHSLDYIARSSTLRTLQGCSMPHWELAAIDRPGANIICIQIHLSVYTYNMEYVYSISQIHIVSVCTCNAIHCAFIVKQTTGFTKLGSSSMNTSRKVGMYRH